MLQIQLRIVEIKDSNDFGMLANVRTFSFDRLGSKQRERKTKYEQHDVQMRV